MQYMQYLQYQFPRRCELAAIIIKGIPDELRDAFKARCSARGITLREGIIELMMKEARDKHPRGLLRKYKVGRHRRGSELIDAELIEAKNSVKALKRYIQKHREKEPVDENAIVEDTWEMGNYRRFMVKENSYLVIPE
jgi:hypothetical protein